MTEITTENAADEIVAQAHTILKNAISRDTNIEDDAARSLMTYLILRDVWSQLAQTIGLTPDDLREEAGNMEEENEEEDDD